MAQNIIGHCPICSEELVATKLTCKHCGLELSNDFSLNKFNLLDNEDFYFLEKFLKYSGNLKELQQSLKISYPVAKKRLQKIQQALGYLEITKDEEHIEIILAELPIYKDESTTVKKIKNKLNESNGLATIKLPKGGSFKTYYEEYGNGIYATNIPHSKVLTWKAFDLATELMIKNGGSALKGQAMKSKLGEPGLTLDTIEGYVAHYAYGVKLGESTLRTISALSSILEWAGVCINGYGYLQLL